MTLHALKRQRIELLKEQDQLSEWLAQHPQTSTRSRMRHRKAGRYTDVCHTLGILKLKISILKLQTRQQEQYNRASDFYHAVSELYEAGTEVGEELLSLLQDYEDAHVGDWASC